MGLFFLNVIFNSFHNVPDRSDIWTNIHIRILPHAPHHIKDVSVSVKDNSLSRSTEWERAWGTIKSVFLKHRYALEEKTKKDFIAPSCLEHFSRMCYIKKEFPVQVPFGKCWVKQWKSRIFTKNFFRVFWVCDNAPFPMFDLGIFHAHHHIWGSTGLEHKDIYFSRLISFTKTFMLLACSVPNSGLGVIHIWILILVLPLCNHREIS